MEAESFLPRLISTLLHSVTPFQRLGNTDNGFAVVILVCVPFWSKSPQLRGEHLVNLRRPTCQPIVQIGHHSCWERPTRVICKQHR